MNELKSLDSLFKEKIFRIPDYQRGYAWQVDQLRDFWEDLINLESGLFHYTGVLTLKEVKSNEINQCDNEFWLIDDYSYKMYNVVDGQQRLTTFIVLLQSFIDFKKQHNKNIKDKDIYITNSLNLEEVTKKYLYKTKPTGDKYRTYKFGYTEDNPSYEYLRYKIFAEEGFKSIEETFYTLNLKNAKIYFYEQLKNLYCEFGNSGLQDVYKKLTKNLLFNEYVIKEEFDVFVAFETMNNRGKKLSALELLKNRMIYLTTLYSEEEFDEADRKSLREAINDAWKEVYYQLGRNDKKPLNDDDFLKAHWIIYFQYSRKKGNDYIKFLLDEYFSPKRIYKRIEEKVDIELPKENTRDFFTEELDSDNETQDYEDIAKIDIISKKVQDNESNKLKPIEIKEYVNSLKESAQHWFNSYYPNLSGLDEREKDSLNQLNRVGIGYFRPLVMSVLKNEKSLEKRIELFKQVEKFIFVIFRLSQFNSNYRDSIFYRASREFNLGIISIEDIKQKLEEAIKEFCIDEGGTFNVEYFYNYLYKKFNNNSKSGYYGWNGVHYFLYEYELDLLSKSRQKKVEWEDLFKTAKDIISIEHIFPQTLTEKWKEAFQDIDEKIYPFYRGNIGNLLLLSRSINSSLQNDDFDSKKKPKFNAQGEKIRNGYLDGSHSEIEVSQYEQWTPKEIEERGLKLLSFMEKRWNIKFRSEDKRKILFLEKKNKNTFK